MMYAINEIFETIQGEAHFTGTPSVFVRLQYCDVGCAWCDTKHTWELKTEDLVSKEEIYYKTTDSSTYCLMTSRSIVEYISNHFSAKHVVITGGEPCYYDLNELTNELIDEDYNVQIETSGTYEIRCHPSVWVTVSPKVNMAGKKEVLESAIKRANEIKHPVGKQSDIDNVPKVESKKIWLQPLSQSPKATELCIKTAIEKNWNVSIQTHKFIGVR